MKKFFLLAATAIFALGSIAHAEPPAPLQPQSLVAPEHGAVSAPTAFETYSLAAFELKPVETVSLKTFAAQDDLTFRPAVAQVTAPKPAVPINGKAISGGISAFLAFLCIGTVINAHGTFDTNNLVTKALPAAGAANASNAINLFSATAGRIPRVEISVQLPATPSLADTKNITLTLKDSADGVTFAAIADLPTIVALGAGGVGAAAIDRRFKLPINVRQYIRLDAAVDAAGGDNTAISAQLALVF